MSRQVKLWKLVWLGTFLPVMALAQGSTYGEFRLRGDDVDLPNGRQIERLSLHGLLGWTDSNESLEWGVSTRAALDLRRAAQAHALIHGRDYCIPEDVAALACDVFAHRVSLRLQGGIGRDPSEAHWIVQEILDRVPVPL